MVWIMKCPHPFPKALCGRLGSQLVDPIVAERREDQKKMDSPEF
jgi:hypothetical protein